MFPTLQISTNPTPQISTNPTPHASGRGYGQQSQCQQVGHKPKIQGSRLT